MGRALSATQTNFLLNVSPDEELASVTLASRIF